jgi:hypothetical protein
LREGLEEKWWERHFRGFEAGLPLKLICNLQPLFDNSTEEVKEEQIILDITE